MHSRKARANAWRTCLITAAACVPVAVVAYAVTSAHGGRAADAADVTVPGTIGATAQTPPGPGTGGWGRGGYTMMPGPAAASTGTGSAGTGNTEVGGTANGSAANAANAAAATSENWAGYATAGTPGQFTSVSASWTQPAVTCTATSTFASFWVGLDGDGTASVEQAGTEADCDAGTATYQGWFEMFPNAPVFYDNPVKPGDAMSASVVANGGGAFTLTLTDTTEGWTQTTNQSSNTAQLGSAEVIAEAPSDGNVLPLSNFGTVDFANATVDNAPIGNENASALTMVSAAGVTEATPSALTGDNAFTVTWDSNGTSTTAATSPATSPAPGPTPATAPAAGGLPGSHHHHHHHHHHFFGG